MRLDLVRDEDQGLGSVVLHSAGSGDMQVWMQVLGTVREDSRRCEDTKILTASRTSCHWWTTLPPSARSSKFVSFINIK